MAPGSVKDDAASLRSAVICAQRDDPIRHVSPEEREALALRRDGGRRAMSHVTGPVCGVLWVVANARGWTDTDIERAAEKLAAIGCCTVADLRSAVSLGGRFVNPRLKSEGFTGFRSATMGAFQLAVAVRDNDVDRAQRVEESIEKLADEGADGCYCGILWVVAVQRRWSPERVVLTHRQLKALKLSDFDTLCCMGSNWTCGGMNDQLTRMGLPRMEIRVFQALSLSCQHGSEYLTERESEEQALGTGRLDTTSDAKWNDLERTLEKRARPRSASTHNDNEISVEMEEEDVGSDYD